MNNISFLQTIFFLHLICLLAAPCQEVEDAMSQTDTINRYQISTNSNLEINSSTNRLEDILLSDAENAQLNSTSNVQNNKKIIVIPEEVNFNAIDKILTENIFISAIRTSTLDNQKTQITFETTLTESSSTLEKTLETTPAKLSLTNNKATEAVPIRKINLREPKTEATLNLNEAPKSYLSKELEKSKNEEKIKEARASIDLTKTFRKTSSIEETKDTLHKTEKPNTKKHLPDLLSSKKINSKNFFTKILSLAGIRKKESVNDKKDTAISPIAETASTKLKVSEKQRMSKKEITATSPKKLPITEPANKNELSGINFKNGLVIELTNESQYSFVKAGSRKYILTLEEFRAPKHLLLPYFAPKDFENISTVKANRKDKSLEIVITLDSDKALSALPEGKNIIIKAT